MRSLAEGVRAAERDVSDKTAGLAEVPCYSASFIDKFACLPACLPAWARGAATWCCMLMSVESSSRKMKGAGEEGVGGNDRWRDAAASSDWTWRVREEEKGEKVK